MAVYKFLKKIFPPIVLGISLCAYLSVLIRPEHFWVSVLLAYTIPVVAGLNVFLLALAGILNRKLSLYYLIGTLGAIPFILVSVNFGNGKSNGSTEFTVSSLNAKFFRPPETYYKFSNKSIDWLLNDTSDIICVQEFSDNPKLDRLDLQFKMYDRDYDYFSNTKTKIHSNGMAIFTKHPILNSGVVIDNGSTVHNVIFIDIKLNTDTIRIYNAHMASLRLDLRKYKYADNMANKIKKLINRLRFGAITRTEQIEQFLTHAAECPYPFVICGDFNETPYSYNYFKLRRELSNSFESAGSGLGFTFHKGPVRLRIDHHFYSDGLQVRDFKVNEKMNMSDHYPISGTYSLN